MTDVKREIIDKIVNSEDPKRAILLLAEIVKELRAKEGEASDRDREKAD